MNKLSRQTITSSKLGANLKPRRTKKNRAQKNTLPLSRLRLITTLIMAALFGLSLYSLYQTESPQKEYQGTSSIQQKDLIVEEKSIQSDKNNYTFYGKLKDFEVVIDENDAYSESDNSTIGSYVYLIQTGSFKTKSQAEQLLVELKLLGLEPAISRGKKKSGDLWYRVRLGPFSSRSNMAAARSTIIANGLEAMVMQRKI